MQHSSIADELAHLYAEKAQWVGHAASLEQKLEAVKAAVMKLVNKRELRWRHIGMDSYSCSSCGSTASMNGNGDIKRSESCSRSCPWKMIEDFYGIA